MKITKDARNTILVSMLLLLVFICQGCGGVFFPLPYRSLAPFDGKVIDADTKEPIAGAVVLAVYYFTSYTVAGSNSYVEDGQETLTDKNGEFKVPRTRRWFVLRRGYPEGALTIFKPGYGVFPNHKRSEAVGANKSWPPPKKYIIYKIPKLKTREERIRNLPSSYSDIPYNMKKQYIKSINIKRKALGAKTFFNEPKKEQ